MHLHCLWFAEGTHVAPIAAWGTCKELDCLSIANIRSVLLQAATADGVHSDGCLTSPAVDDGRTCVLNCIQVGPCDPPGQGCRWRRC